MATDNYDPTTGPPPPREPSAPPPPDPINTDIQSLIDLIRGDGGVYSRFMDAADRLQAIAEGKGDPAFQYEQGQALAGTADQFRRRGLGFSAAEQNAAGRVRQQYGTMRLQRQDAAQQQYLDTLSAATETYALPTELLIAQRTADKAGSGGGGGGTVICTELHRRGDLPDAIYEADSAYGRAYIGVDALRGYHLWAEPLVRLAQESPLVYAMIRPPARHWAYHMAYLMRRHDRPDRIGAFLLVTGVPVCTLLGRMARKLRELRRRWALHGYSEV